MMGVIKGDTRSLDYSSCRIVIFVMRSGLEILSIRIIFTKRMNHYNYCSESS